MLRTSLRRVTVTYGDGHTELFLSSNAQDFIEESSKLHGCFPENLFLSSNAQDFIEERLSRHGTGTVSDS